MKHFHVAFIIWLVALLGSAALPLSAVAQSPQPSSEPGGDYVFRSTVRRVPIDVVVQDKDGKPVRGLKQSDFVVQEDRKDQKVLSFDVADGSAAAFVPPKLPPMPPNTYVDLPRETERKPLYVLYYDMVNMSPDDQMSFRAQLLKFVDHAAPGTRMALFVNAKGLHMVQGFTTEHSLLREAILRKGPPPSIPDVFLFGEVYGQYDAGATLSNLNFIAEYLSGLPERKNLIWLATYFPIPVGPTVTAYDTVTPSSPVPSRGIGGNGGPTTLDLSELLTQSIKHTYASLMQSRVALYPVSVSGVAGTDLNSYDRMDMIAASTGGHAYYSNNFTSELIEKALEHGENYYTLSYSPQNTNFDGSERKIHVSLVNDSKKYRLTYRNVYYAVSDEEVQDSHKKQVVQQRFLAAKAADTLYATAEHGAPMMHDLLFIAHMASTGEPRMASPEEMRSLEESPAFFRTRKHNPKPLAPVKLQQYVINYDVIDPRLRAVAKTKQGPTVLEFAAAAYNNDGTLLNSILNKGIISTDVQPHEKVDHRFQAVQQLQVPPGAAFIRLVVRNTLNDRTGALEVKLPLKPQTETASAGDTHRSVSN